MPPHIAAQCTPPIRPASSAAPRVSQSIGIAAWRWCLVAQNVDCRRVEILELAAANGPGEAGDDHQQQHQADRYQDEQDVHAADLDFAGGVRVSRSALPTTSSEDSAMPSAASHGVTRPAIATGRAMTL